ncbi:hypothetical protein GDO81_013984 [Engystomops pustulosus]|uniref:Uncharacterized protein n=1 Tax=Engystomops pustulosus TaxID=76066 RepID=A0AAV7B7F4_ENGPU|nr:hypothetical protein GDO81_013984 [Engystomops pustulosus]
MQTQRKKMQNLQKKTSLSNNMQPECTEALHICGNLLNQPIRIYSFIYINLVNIKKNQEEKQETRGANFWQENNGIIKISREGHFIGFTYGECI